MNRIGRLSVVVLAMAVVALVTQAQEAPPAKSSEAGAPKSQTRAASREGKIIAFDKAAGTITIGPLDGAATAEGPVVYNVSGGTLVMKDGKLAKLSDIVAGVPARYVVKRAKDGKMMVSLIRFGKEPERKQPAEK